MQRTCLRRISSVILQRAHVILSLLLPLLLPPGHLVKCELFDEAVDVAVKRYPLMLLLLLLLLPGHQVRAVRRGGGCGGEALPADAAGSTAAGEPEALLDCERDVLPKWQCCAAGSTAAGEPGQDQHVVQLLTKRCA
jgi:hypothetical protein